jgi:hypothetical protein
LVTLSGDAVGGCVITAANQDLGDIDVLLLEAR